MGSTFTQLALKSSTQLTDTEQRFLLVAAEHLVKTHDGLAVQDTQKTVEGFTATSIAATGSADVWPVNAGERFLIQSVVISSDIDTLFELFTTLQILITARISANQPFIFNFPNDGYLAQADADRLRLKNASGNTTIFSIWAMGYRVTSAGLFLR